MNESKIDRNAKIIFIALAILFSMAFCIDLVFFAKKRWEWGPIDMAFSFVGFFIILNVCGLFGSMIVLNKIKFLVLTLLLFVVLQIIMGINMDKFKIFEHVVIIGNLISILITIIIRLLEKIIIRKNVA